MNINESQVDFGTNESNFTACIHKFTNFTAKLVNFNFFFGFMKITGQKGHQKQIVGVICAQGSLKPLWIFL